MSQPLELAGADRWSAEERALLDAYGHAYLWALVDIDVTDETSALEGSLGYLLPALPDVTALLEQLALDDRRVAALHRAGLIYRPPPTS